MFSLTDIEKSLNIPKNKREFEARTQIQRQDTDNFIQKYQQCPIDNQEIFQHIASLNVEGVKELKQKEFYNYNNVQAVSCITESLISISPEWRNLIIKYLIDLKQVGEKSSNGFAYITELNNPNKVFIPNSLFVIKKLQTNNTKDIEASKHEYVVGCILNSLRQLIPNFSCVFGYFSCGETTTARDGGVGSWCVNTFPDQQTSYIIYENVDNSRSLSDVINSKLSTQKYLEYILQFSLALKLANKLYNFTHYDCHPSNVLLKKLPQNVLIKYPFSLSHNTQDIYIETDSIVTFIDYGYSYVEFTDENKKFLNLE